MSRETGVCSCAGSLSAMEVRIKLLLFLIVIISSNAKKMSLTGVEGGSITFPDPVFERGFLVFEGKPIAEVTERKVNIWQKPYKDRLLWNNITGRFTMTRLQRNDSGIWIIDSVEGRVFAEVYELRVFESVMTPSLNTVNVSAESCTLLCTMEKAAETTLFWWKDEEIVNQSSSSLCLPLTILTQNYSSSYKCEAANPADRKTLEVNVTLFCSGNKISDTNQGIDVASVVIPTAVLVLVVLVSVYFAQRLRNPHMEPNIRDTTQY